MRRKGTWEPVKHEGSVPLIWQRHSSPQGHLMILVLLDGTPQASLLQAQRLSASRELPEAHTCHVCPHAAARRLEERTQTF